jgi:hypothetical protein
MHQVQQMRRTPGAAHRTAVASIDISQSRIPMYIAGAGSVGQLACFLFPSTLCHLRSRHGWCVSPWTSQRSGTDGSISFIGDHDYFGSVIATYVFLAELGLSSSLLLVVLATVLYSSTIHRSAVSVNVYLTCTYTLPHFTTVIMLISCSPDLLVLISHSSYPRSMECLRTSNGDMFVLSHHGLRLFSFVSSA